MSGIASLGVGSGLDLQSLVQRLVANERAPAEGRLVRNTARVQAQLSALGQVKSGLARLDEALKGLAGLATARSVQLTPGTALSATASATADLGRYAIEVFNLASAQSLASDTFLSPDASLGAGELVLQLAGDDPVTIVLEEGADSLRDLRNAINESGAKVRASIIKDGDAYRLLLTATETGADRVISLVPGDGVDARLDSSVWQVTSEARNASFSVDGLVLSSPTNTVSDVLPGVTLTLRAASEQPATLTVGQDEQSARKAVDAFVLAYNAMVDMANGLSGFNVETQQGSVLTGDATLRAIRAMLPAALGVKAEDAYNAVELGIRSELNGKIKLDADAFGKVVSGDLEGSLASLRGFADRLGADIKRYTSSDGLLANRTDGLNATLRTINSQRDALKQRMESYEARLVRQFASLDKLVSQMNSTSNFLGTQLAAIANISNPKR